MRNTETRPFSAKIIAFGIPILLLITSILLAVSNYAALHPVLYIGITYDLILTIPLSYYFLSKGRAPKLFFGLFLSAGVLLAYFLIPDSEKYHFDLIRFMLLPLVEFSIMASILYYTYRMILETKNNTIGTPDYLILFQESAIKAFENQRIGKIFGSELSMLYYAFSLKKAPKLKENEFSYYKKSGSIALLGALLLAILAETIGMHFLLAKWSVIVAGILTFLSLYSFLMIYAHIKAILRRPHCLKEDALVLKTGLLGTTKIAYSNIESIKFSKQIPTAKNGKAVQFTALGEAESFNTIIYLKEAQDCEFIYGMKKPFQTLMILVDDIHGFEAEMKKHLPLLTVT